MRIPTRVKVGGIEYGVIQLKPKDGKLVKVKNWGEVDFNECRIYIDEGADEQRKWQILIHEVIHVIECDNNMDSSDNYIQTISSGFYAFLKDNKLLKE